MTPRVTPLRETLAEALRLTRIMFSGSTAKNVSQIRAVCSQVEAKLTDALARCDEARPEDQGSSLPAIGAKATGDDGAILSEPSQAAAPAVGGMTPPSDEFWEMHLRERVEHIYAGICTSWERDGEGLINAVRELVERASLSAPATVLATASTGKDEGSAKDTGSVVTSAEVAPHPASTLSAPATPFRFNDCPFCTLKCDGKCQEFAKAAPAKPPTCPTCLSASRAFRSAIVGMGPNSSMSCTDAWHDAALHAPSDGPSLEEGRRLMTEWGDAVAKHVEAMASLDANSKTYGAIVDKASITRNALDAWMVRAATGAPQ